jgi:hypothetical protein
MTAHQEAVFVEERKWDYRSMNDISLLACLLTLRSVFGFVAALLEGLPIVGLVFTVSNRIGAAMWAHGMFVHRCSPSYIPIFLQIWKSVSTTLQRNVVRRLQVLAQVLKLSGRRFC